jgi:hypothetical protein
MIETKNMAACLPVNWNQTEPLPLPLVTVTTEDFIHELIPPFSRAEVVAEAPLICGPSVA